MNENTSPLTMFLTIFSILYGGIGGILGILFLFNNVEIAAVLFMLAASGSVILFSIGKGINMIHNLQQVFELASITSTTKTEEIHNQKAVEFEGESPNHNEQLSNDYTEWSLSKKDEHAIMEHYGTRGSKIEEIIPIPIPYFCIIKAEDFVDVIELKKGVPQILTRSDVDNNPPLRDWIEEHLFGKNE